MINGISFAPVEVGTVAADGSFSGSAAGPLMLAWFSDATTLGMILPLRSVSFSGDLSDSHACIGSYAAGSLADVACAADDTHPAFTAGATLEGLLALEDADTIDVPSLGQSLCVVLGGAGDGASPIQRCRRDAGGAIEFRGDACTTGGGTCGDAVAFRADVAASAVTLR
jgi:hypothetical protein